LPSNEFAHSQTVMDDRFPEDGVRSTVPVFGEKEPIALKKLFRSRRGSATGPQTGERERRPTNHAEEDNLSRSQKQALKMGADDPRVAVVRRIDGRIDMKRAALFKIPATTTNRATLSCSLQVINAYEAANWCLYVAIKSESDECNTCGSYARQVFDRGKWLTIRLSSACNLQKTKAHPRPKFGSVSVGATSPARGNKLTTKGNASE